PGFERLSGEPAGFGDVLLRQRSPSVSRLYHPTPADQSRGRRVGRIDRQRPPREDDCLGNALFGKAIWLCQCTQIEVVSGEVRGRLAAGALDLGLAQLWFDRAGDAGGDLILQLKNVVEHAVEAVVPDVSAGCRVDQLPGDAHPVAG